MTLTQARQLYNVTRIAHRHLFRWLFIVDVPYAVCECGVKMTMGQVLDYLNANERS
jgi:hypothetical protein